MKRRLIQNISILLLFGFLISCSSTKDLSRYNKVPGYFIESGIASWYGPNFHGKTTANGETFNMDLPTAAHRTLPFNSIVKVLNRENDKSVIVRINDRGPWAKNRIIDLSRFAAEKIGLINNGSAEVDLILLTESKMPEDLKIPRYTVQVGSFTKLYDANKFSASINNSRVAKAIIDGTVYYRIYVGMFTKLSDAKELQNALEDEGITGFVKQVEN